MSIKVNVRKLSPWRNDLPDQIRVEKLNEVAEDFAREITHQLGDLRCSEHPDEVSYLTVIADRHHTMLVEKTFCCQQFEKIVSRKIER